MECANGKKVNWLLRSWQIGCGLELKEIGHKKLGRGDVSNSDGLPRENISFVLFRLFLPRYDLPSATRTSPIVVPPFTLDFDPSSLEMNVVAAPSFFALL